ncbi:MAG: hypothetical protein A2046_06230 [Bacteroidetes bacterium GWA2_30_7]|nr:MAG: hypothetical protein A2046_06230 [Bacteroidetes bacterium GWA2_30_7]
MQFKDIIGQVEAKKRLLSAVKGNRISHSVLFLGPEGSGKLGLAIAYAQYISCENKTEDDSCGVCKSCLKYNKLVHPDLHFVFPVVKTKKITKEPISDNFINEWREYVLKNHYFSLNQWTEFIADDENKQAIIGVNESSEIIKKLSFKTFESEYKVMIIWFPEKMNKESSNRLLKILEEPFEKTLFILISEDSGNIIQTILSRTQLFKISKIDDSSIINFLIDKHSIEEQEAVNIAKLSHGNIINMLQILGSEENQAKFLEEFSTMMRSAFKGDTIEISNWSKEKAKTGREKIKEYLIYCLRMIRENYLMTNNVSELVQLTGGESEFSKKFHPFVNSRNVPLIYDEINKAHFHIERNGNASIILLDLALKIMQNIKK